MQQGQKECRINAIGTFELLYSFWAENIIEYLSSVEHGETLVEIRSRDDCPPIFCPLLWVVVESTIFSFIRLWRKNIEVTTTRAVLQNDGGELY